MNSRMKRFNAITLALLLLLNCFFTVAQTPIPPKVGKVYIDYGLESEMRIPSKILRTISNVPPGTSVSSLLRSLLIFNEAGGIMFDAVGQPCAGLANARLKLGYNRKQPDGRRLTLYAGTKAYTVAGIYDRDLRPIAQFADSTVPVLTNLQYPDPPIRESCPLPSTSLRVVTLHPALLDTHLGGLMIGMDYIPWKFSVGKRWNSTETLPDATLPLSDSLAVALYRDEIKYSKEWPMARARLANRFVSGIGSMSKADREQYVRLVEARNQRSYDWEESEAKLLAETGVNKAEWQKLSVGDRRILLTVIESFDSVRVSNINDDETPPSFCTQASTVKLDGSPNLQFIAPWDDETYILPLSSMLMTENIFQLRLVDEEAYDGTMRIYRLGGLFRYVKQQSPVAWRQFLKKLPRKEKKETYTIVCPDCKKADVEAWLTCIGENFPSTQ